MQATTLRPAPLAARFMLRNAARQALACGALQPDDLPVLQGLAAGRLQLLVAGDGPTPALGRHDAYAYAALLAAASRAQAVPALPGEGGSLAAAMLQLAAQLRARDLVLLPI